jgi:hypothetical protein
MALSLRHQLIYDGRGRYDSDEDVERSGELWLQEIDSNEQNVATVAIVIAYR